jgi:hypothetical protein
MWTGANWYERGLVGQLFRRLERRPVPLAVIADRGPLPSGPVVFHPTLTTAAEAIRRL